MGDGESTEPQEWRSHGLERAVISEGDHDRSEVGECAQLKRLQGNSVLGEERRSRVGSDGGQLKGLFGIKQDSVERKVGKLSNMKRNRQ